MWILAAQHFRLQALWARAAQGTIYSHIEVTKETIALQIADILISTLNQANWRSTLMLLPCNTTLSNICRAVISGLILQIQRSLIQTTEAM